MDINAILPYLKHPDDENEPSFFIENNWLLDKNSTSKYKLVNTLIDFEGTLVNQSQEPSPEKSLLFQLNRIFSQNIDFIILTSLFAGGGIGFKRLRKRLIQWYASLKAEPVLFLEPEDKHLLSSIGAENCITVMDLEHRNVIPKLDSLPDLNASFENIPIKSESFNIIISYFVLEHVKNPQCHFKELSRILKPGGHLIVAGPGDVYPSHRIPYNYYNLTRYAYQEMIKENHLELIEESFPSKTWLSILYLCYTSIVRKSLYNKNNGLKLLQLMLFLVALPISPFLNGIALLMDWLIPFDKKIYATYLALIRKPSKITD